MTSKETIKEFEHLLKVEKDRVHKDVVFITDLENAIEALEKQIPKKPNNIYCPICKRPLRKAKEDIGYTGKVKKRKADNYCPGCGQALDWSSENE